MCQRWARWENRNSSIRLMQWSSFRKHLSRSINVSIINSVYHTGETIIVFALDINLNRPSPRHGRLFLVHAPPLPSERWKFIIINHRNLPWFPPCSAAWSSFHRRGSWSTWRWVQWAPRPRWRSFPTRVPRGQRCRRWERPTKAYSIVNTQRFDYGLCFSHRISRSLCVALRLEFLEVDVNHQTVPLVP